MPTLSKSIIQHPVDEVKKTEDAQGREEVSDEEIDPLDAYMQEISANNIKQEANDQRAEPAGKVATTITFEDFQGISASGQADEDNDQAEVDEDEAFHSEFVK